MGRFIIVESPEEVVWLPNAKAKEKAKVAARLMPLTYNGHRLRRSPHFDRHGDIPQCAFQNGHKDRAQRNERTGS